MNEPTVTPALIQSMDEGTLTKLIEDNANFSDPSIALAACEAREPYYGRRVFVRGLVEFTNYCRNGCHYCGINRANRNVFRYRLDDSQIAECLQNGYDLGFRSFVLQGGEDPYFEDDRMVSLVEKIHRKFSDCSLTLSLGERSYSSYKRLYEAGANRYLLRHETANAEHYSMLHPGELSLKKRKECLYNLKAIGYQVGSGVMVGSPYQTYRDLACDLLFLKELKPHMVGLGPFIPHHDTVFSGFKPGSVNLTLLMIALTRLMLPDSMIPATTALNSLDPMGHEHGLEHGANVIMPNLSPDERRLDYSLYDNKRSTGTESAECILLIREKLGNIGYEMVMGRGDHYSLTH